MADRHKEFRGVVEVSPGRWRVRARARDPKTGKSRELERMVRCKTKLEAAEARRALVAELEGGGAGKRAERLKFRQLSQSWLERRAPMLRPSTSATHAHSIGDLNTYFGDFFVDAIRPVDVERWQGELRARGLAPATINGRMAILRAIAKSAARDLSIPCFTDGVPALKVGRTKGPRGTALTAEQLGLFLAAAERLGRIGRDRVVDGQAGIGPDSARMLIVLAWTGLRRGELIALRTSDVDGDQLCISRSVWQHHETPPKNGEPRIVALAEPAARAIEEQRRWLVATQHPALSTGLIFPADAHHARSGATRRGVEVKDWYRFGSLYKAIHRVTEAAGLPRISLHSLRRTCDSLMIRAGVDGLVRRSQFGWRDSEIEEVYAQVCAESRRAAGVALVALVRGPEKSSSGESSGESPSRTGKARPARKG
jgi:integrase